MGDLATWQGIATAIQMSGIFDFGSSIITPAALTANTNDYAPAGGDNAMLWRISATTPINLTGIAAPPAGTWPLRWVSNVGAANITLVKQSVLSAAANRFSVPPATIITQGEGSRPLYYDQILQRWKWLF